MFSGIGWQEQFITRFCVIHFHIHQTQGWQNFLFSCQICHQSRQVCQLAPLTTGLLKIIFFIPRILHDYFTTPNQQNAQNPSLDICVIILKWPSLHVSIRKRSSSGNQTKSIQRKTKLANFIQTLHDEIFKTYTFLCRIFVGVCWI